MKQIKIEDLHFYRCEEFDFITEENIKYYYVCIEDKESGDVLDYVSFLSENEAENYISENNKQTL